MGDYFEILVDVEATEDEATGAAAQIVDWLVAQGVVVAGRTDCVLGGDGGHAPGPGWKAAVVPGDASSIDWSVNGLAVSVGREFHSGIQAMELERATCPRCGGPGPDHTEGVAERIMAAVGEWYDGGDGHVACPACGSFVGLNDWTWGDASPIAAGALALTFWNWPQLSSEFADAVSRQLGHRVVRVWGKL